MTAPLTRSHHADDDHHDPDAAGARRALAAAQRELLPAMPPCVADPAKWYDPARMAAAIAGCSGCPLLVECDGSGSHELHGVWAGINRDRNVSARSYGATGFRAKRAPAHRSPKRRKRYGTPMPVTCDYCGAGPGAVCRTGDGREAEDAHEIRKRVARSTAA
jgi:hypothetical protein